MSNVASQVHKFLVELRYMYWKCNVYCFQVLEGIHNPKFPGLEPLGHKRRTKLIEIAELRANSPIITVKVTRHLKYCELPIKKLDFGHKSRTKLKEIAEMPC